MDSSVALLNQMAMDCSNDPWGIKLWAQHISAITGNLEHCVSQHCSGVHAREFFFIMNYYWYSFYRSALLFLKTENMNHYQFVIATAFSLQWAQLCNEFRLSFNTSGRIFIFLTAAWQYNTVKWLVTSDSSFLFRTQIFKRLKNALDENRVICKVLIEFAGWCIQTSHWLPRIDSKKKNMWEKKATGDQSISWSGGQTMRRTLQI